MAKILVVDDEVGIRELLSEILRDEGHSVQLADNAAAARAARSAARPGIVNAGVDPMCGKYQAERHPNRAATYDGDGSRVG